MKKSGQLHKISYKDVSFKWSTVVEQEMLLSRRFYKSKCRLQQHFLSQPLLITSKVKTSALAAFFIRSLLIASNLTRYICLIGAVSFETQCLLFNLLCIFSELMYMGLQVRSIAKYTWCFYSNNISFAHADKCVRCPYCTIKKRKLARKVLEHHSRLRAVRYYKDRGSNNLNKIDAVFKLFLPLSWFGIARNHDLAPCPIICSFEKVLHQKC